MNNRLTPENNRDDINSIIRSVMAELKGARRASKISEQIGKSSGYISQIESGKIKLSLQTLFELTKVFNIDDQALASIARPNMDYVICRNQEGIRFNRPGCISNSLRYILKSFAFPPGVGWQVAIIEFDPNMKDDNTNYHFHYGDEFLFMLEGDGRFEMKLAYLPPLESKHHSLIWQNEISEIQKPIMLSAGENWIDSSYIWLNSGLPHRYVNFSARKAKALAIYFDPTFANPTQLLKGKHNPFALRYGVGIEIQKARIHQSLTIKELAEKLNGRLTKSYISRLENSEINPDLSTLQDICDALNLDISQLLTPLRWHSNCLSSILTKGNGFLVKRTEHISEVTHMEIHCLVPPGYFDVGSQLSAFYYKFEERDFSQVEPKNHVGQEIAYVLEGELTFFCFAGRPQISNLFETLANRPSSYWITESGLEFKSVKLLPGDLIYVNSATPHGFASNAPESKALVFHWRHNATPGIVREKEESHGK